MPGPYNTFTVEHFELYNLDSDIGETTDVSHQYPEVVAELNIIADSARNELGDKLKNQKGRGVRKPGRIIQKKTEVNNLASGKKITIKGEAGFEYAGQGDITLINGILGSYDFTDGEWLGFQGQDIEINIDLEKALPLNRIIVSALENQEAWIFSPGKMIFSVSNDGIDYKRIQVINSDSVQPKQEALVRKFIASVKDQNVRFVKIIAESIITCPPWHAGAGGKAWIFMDEVIVE